MVQKLVGVCKIAHTPGIGYVQTPRIRVNIFFDYGNSCDFLPIASLLLWYSYVYRFVRLFYFWAKILLSEMIIFALVFAQVSKTKNIFTNIFFLVRRYLQL